MSFYEVAEATPSGKTVRLRRIGKRFIERDGTDNAVVPNPNAESNPEPQRRRVQSNGTINMGCGYCRRVEPDAVLYETSTMYC